MHVDIYNYKAFNYVSGIGLSAISSDNVTLDARCTYSVSLTMGEAGNASQPIMIDSVVFVTTKDNVLGYTSLGKSAFYLPVLNQAGIYSYLHTKLIISYISLQRHPRNQYMKIARREY